MRILFHVIPVLCLMSPVATLAAPNILLIIADDMGLDTSLCYNVADQQAPMPNLERMCSEGLVFDNAYSDPVCSPTRATIMTGKYGFRTGVGAAISRVGGRGLSPDETSLFDVMDDTEYSSALIGKWHLAGPDDTLNHPAELGVDEYFGIFKGAIPNYFEWVAVHNGEQVQIDGYATTVLTDHAIEWIDGQESPWFLWLAYNAPHAPFHLPPADLQSFGDLPTDKASIAENRLPYYNAALQAMDTEMGRLLDSLGPEARDNTVVIFIGDNGTPNQVARSLYAPRGAKGSIFDGGTHVPMVVQGPGMATGRTDALVNTTDLFATIAALAGVETDAPDAYDFRSILDGGAGPRNYAYVEQFSPDGPSRADVFGWAIRDMSHALVAVDGQPQMLFDLESDPFERSDLLSTGGSSTDAQADAAKLQAAFEAIKAE